MIDSNEATRAGSTVVFPDRRSLVALVAAFIHLALATAYVAAPRWRGDVSALVCASERRIGDGPYRDLRVGFPSGGYDGQFYYAIAQQPWRKHEAAHIDKPAYRQLRILYPALCWLITGGDSRLLLWAMPAINLFAIAGLAALGAHLAIRHGRSPWWGLLVPFAVNAGSPFLRNLTDPVSSFTVLFLLVAWLRRWPAPWLAPAALLAVLAREQNLAVVALIAALATWERDWRRVLALSFAVAIWILWAALLWRVYDDSPFVLGNFATPLRAMARRLADPYHARTGLPIHLVGVLSMATMMFACAVVVPLNRPERTALLLGWGGTAMAAFGSWAIWEDPHAYLRVFPWVPLALWLWAVQSGRRRPFLLTLPLMPWPLLSLVSAWR